MGSIQDGNRHSNPDNINTSGISEQLSLVVSNYHLVHSLVDGYDTLDTPMVDRNKPLVAPMVDRNKPLVAPMVDRNKPLVPSMVDRNKPLVAPMVDRNKPLVPSMVDRNKPLVTPMVDRNKPLVTPLVVINHPLIYSLVDDYNFLVTPLVDGIKHLVTFCVHGNYSLVNSLVDGSISLVYVSLYGNTATIAAHHYHRHNSELILACFHLAYSLIHNFPLAKVYIVCKTGNGWDASQIARYRRHNTEVQYEFTAINYQRNLSITPFEISQSTSVELQHRGLLYHRLSRDDEDSNFLRLT